VSGVDVCQQSQALQVLEGGRVLGVEDVAQRVRLFGDDLVGEGVLVVVANVDLDAGFCSNAVTSDWVVCSCWPL